MSKPASWTAKENGLPTWAVTAMENMERELGAAERALAERTRERDEARALAEQFSTGVAQHEREVFAAVKQERDALAAAFERLVPRHVRDLDGTVPAMEAYMRGPDTGAVHDWIYATLKGSEGDLDHIEQSLNRFLAARDALAKSDAAACAECVLEYEHDKYPEEIAAARRLLQWAGKEKSD